MASRPPRRRISGNRSRLGPGTTAYVVEMQGFDILSDHFWAMAELSHSMFPKILDVGADIGIELSQELVPVASGETRDSINKSPGVIEKGHRGEWSIRFGPTTFYAPFLEYGTRFMAPRPFTIPGGDLAEQVVYRSILAYLKLFDTNNGGAGFGSGDIIAGRALQDPRIRGSISQFRSLLYSSAKFLGDVSVIGGREIFGPARARMYLLARALGDTSSILSGTLDQRISRRLSGRAVGKLAGVGTIAFSSGRTYSAFPGGEGGRRVYQRVVGRATNIGVSGFRWAGFGN